jgi:hypothetical protein
MHLHRNPTPSEDYEHYELKKYVIMLVTCTEERMHITSCILFGNSRFRTKPICNVAKCILNIILDIKMVDINITYMSYVHYFGFAPNTSLSK